MSCHRFWYLRSVDISPVHDEHLNHLDILLPVGRRVQRGPPVPPHPRAWVALSILQQKSDHVYESLLHCQMEGRRTLGGENDREPIQERNWPKLYETHPYRLPIGRRWARASSTSSRSLILGNSCFLTWSRGTGGCSPQHLCQYPRDHIYSVWGNVISHYFYTSKLPSSFRKTLVSSESKVLKKMNKDILGLHSL